jgi:hypothetical protein
VGGAVRVELDLSGHIDASDEPFEANGLDSNSAPFEADLRYSHHSAMLGLVVVIVPLVVVVTLVGGFVLVFVV